MKPRAYCLIREQPHYRREAFCAGLARLGYEVAPRPAHGIAAGDVLVTWNRYGEGEQHADRFEAAGGTVLVAENAYLDSDPRQRYALARHAHNGRGQWPDRLGKRWMDETETYGARWRALAGELGLTIAEPRSDGEHILVAPNRSFGMRGGVMPPGWAEAVVKRLRAVTDRPVRVRSHPGMGKPAVPLAADLDGCHAVVIWSSSVGVQALLRGIQVRCLAPWWILKATTTERLDNVIDLVTMGERTPAFERLAWAQWTVEEIGSGLAFRHLLSDARQGQGAPAA